MAAQVGCFLLVIDAQNARSYDTNDWIPITPSSNEKSVLAEQKKATGRVLNLDAPPQQKFFPDEDYRKNRQPIEQFLRETSHFPKHRLSNRHKPRYERPYKFESNYQPKPQPQAPLQYFTNQEVKPATVEQPPPLGQPQFIQQPPPYQAPQFIYQPQPQPQISNLPQLPQQQQFAQAFPQALPVDQNYQQYVVPINNTLYHTINPSSINQELLGAIQNTKTIEPVPKVEPTTKPTVGEVEKETVQLLYVPLENLKANQPISQDSQNIYSTAEVPRHEKQIASFTTYNPSQRLAAIEKDFIQQALEAQKLQEEIRTGRPYLYQTTTSKPKKRKPHQPPLAVYMNGQHEAEVSEVLDVLKDAKSIAVQDNFRPDSPKVFIGPSSLNPPDGYSKFPLPYLNNIEGNRIERKIEQLPFFVAPLSYKTPDGYSKIPLPSPHVGSVVVSTKDDPHDKHPPNYQQTYGNINQLQNIEKTKTGQFLTQNANVQDYNFQALAQRQPLTRLNENIQFINPTTPEEVKQNYQIPARPDLPKLPPTLQEPVRQLKPLAQEIVKDQVIVQPNSGQNIYRDQNINLGPNTPTPQYDAPVRSTTPQIAIDEYGQYHIKSTLAPESLDTKYTIPTRDPFIQVVKSTTPLPLQSFNLSDKIKSSIEITPSVEITPKSVTQGSLRDQLNKEAVPSYEALSNQPPPSQSYNINPLELAINQYELQQINSQLLDKNPKVEQPSQQTSLYYDDSVSGKTRFVSSTPRYEENYQIVTTPRTEKPKRRGKPTHTRQPLRTTPTYDNTKFTVQEDYNIRQRSTTPKTVDIDITPETIYKERQTTTEATEIENIPSKVYKLNPQVQPVYTENRPPINQHILNREVLDQHVLKSYLSSETKPKSEPVTVKYQEIATEVPSVEPLNVQQNKNEPHSQILSGYISNLQDQSVRALLVPNLLVPTTEQQKDLTSTLKYELPSSTTTEREIEYTSKTTEDPHIETTTPFRRTRGRVRANTSGRYTTSAPPRRTVNRRRPTYSRTTTERTSTTTSEYSTRRSVGTNKSRFRTRGRPSQNSLSDRAYSSTTENEIKAFKQPELQSGFQASPLQGEPQSYMQFEHTIDEQKIITVKPDDVSEETPSAIKEYHQVYKLPSSAENSQKPVVDIKITHPLDTKESDIIITPNKNDEYVHFTSNVQSGETGSRHRYSEEVTTQRSNIRVRGRTRAKSRFPSTTARTTSTTTTQKSEEPQEFYGFFRAPDFSKPKLPEQEVIQTTEVPVQYYSSSYVSSPKPKIVYNEPKITYEEQTGLYNQPKTVYNEEFVANGYSTERSELSSPSVHFIGEIRPKYYSTAQYEESKISIATAEQDPTTTETQTSTKRVLTTSSEENLNRYNEVNHRNDQTTRRSRIRSRGKVHYRAPEKLKPTTDEADVEGGNYPASFFRNRETSTAPSFQITVDPLQEEETEDDQSPHSSIYSPKFVPKPSEEWVEASAVPFYNELPSNDKPEPVSENTEAPFALPIVASTEAATDEPITNVFNETTKEMSDILTQINDMVKTEEEPTTTQGPTEVKPTKKKGRRRGVWKLVRHRPVDQFEIAESQNYESVLNNFDVIKKVNYRNQYYEPETRQVFTKATEEPVDIVPTTDTPPENEVEEEITTFAPPTTTSENSIFDTLYDMFGMQTGEEETTTTTTTTTTTEAPTEPAEIITTPTTISPTFPQEITEETFTTTTEKYNSTSEIDKDIPNTTSLPDYEEPAETTRPEVTKNPYEVEPWEMKQVKTSTSTEVSHETEICYKGRCVKSLDRKTRS